MKMEGGKKAVRDVIFQFISFVIQVILYKVNSSLSKTLESSHCERKNSHDK